MIELPKRRKTEQSPFPLLEALSEKNEGIFQEIKSMTSSVRHKQDQFWKGMQKQLDTVVGEQETAHSDGMYPMYEKLKTKEHEIDWKQPFLRELEDGEKKNMSKLLESFEGTGDMLTTATSGGLLLRKRQTLGELRLIQLIGNTRFRSDPHLRSGVLAIKRYIFGNGIRISCENNEIETKLRDVLVSLKIDELMGDCCVQGIIDGEIGILLRSKKLDKKMQFSGQQIYSEEIGALEHSSLNTSKNLSYRIDYSATGGDFGYKNNKKNDTATSTGNPVGSGNLQHWVPDIEYINSLNARNVPKKLDYQKSTKHTSGKFNKNEVMIFLKFGDQRNIRGLSQVESVLKSLRLHEDFVVNRAILNYERSKVLYVHKNKKTSALASKKMSQLNLTKTKAPKGGTELNLFGNEDYEILTPDLHAADAERDGLLFMYEASAGLTLPLNVITQRLHEASYSALKSSDSPFGQMIVDYANFYIAYLGILYKFILKRLVESGDIKQKTVKIKRFAKESVEREFIYEIFTRIREGEDPNDIIKGLAKYSDNMEVLDIPVEELPIDTIIADAVRPNPLEMAKVWFVYRKMGIASRQTLSGKAGFVWEQELYRQLQEMEFFPALGTEDSTAAGVSDKSDPTVDGSDAPGSNTDGNINDGSGTNQGSTE